MCFSATASFVAGAALTATGIVTTRKAKKGELPLASFPLLFGIQQLLDGIAWVAIGHSAVLTSFATYGYAFFAYLFWPIFFPFVALSLEPQKQRRQWLRVLLFIGFLTSLYVLVLMLSGPMTARVINSCIRYDTATPFWHPAIVPYLLAVCGSCLISSKKFVKWFGLVVLVSAAIAAWFYLQTFSSVWCFFSAVLSGMIYWHVARE